MGRDGYLFNSLDAPLIGQSAPSQDAVVMVPVVVRHWLWRRGWPVGLGVRHGNMLRRRHVGSVAAWAFDTRRLAVGTL